MPHIYQLSLANTITVMKSTEIQRNKPLPKAIFPLLPSKACLHKTVLIWLLKEKKGRPVTFVQEGIPKSIEKATPNGRGIWNRVLDHDLSALAYSCGSRFFADSRVIACPPYALSLSLLNRSLDIGRSGWRRASSSLPS